MPVASRSAPDPLDAFDRRLDDLLEDPPEQLFVAAYDLFVAYTPWPGTRADADARVARVVAKLQLDTSAARDAAHSALLPSH